MQSFISESTVKVQNPWVSLPDAFLWYYAVVPTSSPPLVMKIKIGEVVATAAIYEQATRLWTVETDSLWYCPPA